MIEWNATYSVDIPSIDSQHQLLVSMIGQLQEAMLDGRAREVVVPLIAAMNKYAAFHFGYEEELLAAHGYPDLKRHHEQHAILVDELGEIEQKYSSGRLNAGGPLLQFLRSWLVDHICDHDKEFSGFLKSKGVS